jgi:hypothetical protein
MFVQAGGMMSGRRTRAFLRKSFATDMPAVTNRTKSGFWADLIVLRNDEGETGEGEQYTVYGREAAVVTTAK